jgi:hypothetical protein
MPDGSLRVVFVNPATTGTGVVIRTGGRRAVTRVLRLTGPSLAATSDVRFGGAAVAANGTWRPVLSREETTKKGDTRVHVGPSSAVVVSLSR